jgi:hypothetical protein
MAYYGIHGSTPLCWVPLFNIIWDLYADGMHITVNYFNKTLIKTMRGNRDVSAPTNLPRLTTKDHPGFAASELARKKEVQR